MDIQDSGHGLHVGADVVEFDAAGNAFEEDLKTRAVKVLFYNSQVTDDLTARLQNIAKESGVPIVGVSETEPPGLSYQAWMGGQLEATGKALAGPGS